MTIKEHFEQNKYAYFTNVIQKEEAKKLSDHLFDLKDQNLLLSDDQCPLSWAVYSDPLFDELLERLAKPLSMQIGIDLLPAYTYARLYEPGEILERHRDRPSCQISATMTLGYDEKAGLWPIYVQEDESIEKGVEALIDVGDMVLYRGNELCHWREEFKGVWQTQVFLHYVDANGPYSNLKHDARKGLSHHSKDIWEDQIRSIKEQQKENKDRNRPRLGRKTGLKKVK